jgi:hypothetical protein
MKIANRASARPEGRRERKTQARLESQREALLKRLHCLHPTLKANPGYKSAQVLLNSRYVRSKLAARLAILRAAQFMISVLEMTPPT